MFYLLVITNILHGYKGRKGRQGREIFNFSAFELAIFSDIYLRVKTDSLIYEGMLYFLQFRN